MAKAKSQTKDQIFETILEHIMDGLSLSDVCKLPNMPRRQRVHEWLEADSAKADNYARACEIRAERMFDEIIRIADTPVMGEKTRLDPDGAIVEVTRGDMTDHRRLQIDARKWALAKMQPKKYGDKLDVNHGGGIALTGVEVAFVRPNDKPKDA
jgi:hypothetical protein